VSISRTLGKVRRAVGVGAGAAVLVVAGASPAWAGDLHSGGVSPNTGAVDPGDPAPEVLGETVSGGGGGLPVTGADIAGMVGVAAAAVAIGSGAVSLSRRRTQASI
jgi:hypothetical protein